MELASLGSGSRGNATVIRSGETCVLVDLGFSVRETTKRLDQLGLKPEQISACLVTHEHSDHISGVFAFANRYQTPVYLTDGTRRAWQKRQALDKLVLQVVSINSAFRVGEIQVTPVPVPHDAREPVQYTLDNGTVHLGILTDLGMITPVVQKAYEQCSALLVEANHDLEMLRRGSYPASLKRRVSGNWGHLNNAQTAEFVEKLSSVTELSHLIVGHISQQNNAPDLVADAISSAAVKIENIFYANQDSGLDWIDLN